MIAALLGRETIEVPCTVEIEKTPKSLHAHVVLDGDIEIRPGDKVIVHDAPTEIGFGETLSVRRMATITRANAVERLWTRMRAPLDITELYDVSFSDRRRL